MPQELQQSQTTVEEAKQTTTVTTTKKVEQKQNKPDDTSKSLKRTAPADVDSQGDAKRKAIQGPKKTEKQIENTNLKVTDPTAIAANAAAILSSVPSSVAQNVVVAPLISNQQPAINELSHSNMEEYMSNAAATTQVQAPAQPQDNSGNKRAVSTRNLTNDERRQRRLLRNRVAAKECRRKKKAYVADLEEKVSRLEEENARLSKEIEELNTKLSINVLKLEENARLHKEIEELKIKLNTTQQQDAQKSNDDSKIWKNFSDAPDEIESVKHEFTAQS